MKKFVFSVASRATGRLQIKPSGSGDENVRYVQYRKWSPTANDPETANDPQNGPQMILDRKWSRENLRNGMDFMGLITKKDWL